MPSVKELYKKLSDVSINADSINLNTDTLESLVSTTQADVALIKSDIANGVYSDVRDGSGNALTSSARGSQRALSVQVVDASGNQITSFGSSSVSISNFPTTQAISGTVNTYPLQGTTVTSSNFTSTTASSSLVSAVSNRQVLTVLNEGAGVLYISAGGTCTTTSYQVRLASGDYWECPSGQTSLAHTAVFVTAGTARVTQIS
jgi:hypothetical protein